MIHRAGPTGGISSQATAARRCLYQLIPTKLPSKHFSHMKNGDSWFLRRDDGILDGFQASIGVVHLKCRLPALPDSASLHLSRATSRGCRFVSRTSFPLRLTDRYRSSSYWCDQQLLLQLTSKQAPCLTKLCRRRRRPRPRPPRLWIDSPTVLPPRSLRSLCNKYCQT